ncbi:MAG: potassium-transporting ATPase subunit KdpA [Actinomycetia bacterium]|nr:potassium-transporting ATPase subunit KdpA [Actinomycetes bacterium]
MAPSLQAVLAILLVAACLAAIHVPLGRYLHWVFTDPRHTRAERVVYRLGGIDPSVEQRPTFYALSLLAFSLVSLIVLWLLLLLQAHLPYAYGRTMDPLVAFNTAASFVTNTNWQSYVPEASAGYAVQALGLTVQNFVSAGVGLAVAIALIRGLARCDTDRIGNFWVDLVRGTVRVLLPLALLAALVLVGLGVVQTLRAPLGVTTLAGGHQVIQGGLAASQEAIKQLGTNGGGFFGANAAHPLESPNGWTNLLEILLMMAIPSALPRTYGLMVADRRQGWTIAAVMASLGVAGMGLLAWLEVGRGSLEGKEVRFGTAWSAVFASATTSTATGAVDAAHESLTPLGGGVAMLNMMLGELSPGGVGTGLTTMIVMIIVTVFIAGLTVGRTPELLGKTIGRREISLAALAMLVPPALVLVGTGLAVIIPASRAAIFATGPAGFSEVLYAFTSAANNNGSAFAGLGASQPFLDAGLAFAMLTGRFVPLVALVSLAGGLAAQGRRPVTAGTLPTHTPTFAGFLLVVILLLTGLTYFPSLALGPIAGLS